MDVSLKHPFSMLVSGERGVGKTEFTKKLLKSRLIAPPHPPPTAHLNAMFGVMQSISKICLGNL